jgi:SAM-dependent methyltransferase
MNEANLHALVNQVIGDLGGAFGVPLVRLGVSLGLYRALVERGPMTPTELAAATGLADRYLREWLCAQAASNYITYDSATGKFSMTPEQAAVLADEESPVYLAPAFDAAAAYLESEPHIRNAFHTGEGIQWGDQSQCLACAIAKFFRPGYQHNLVQSWLPALDGVVAKLQAGIEVADVGCGHGLSTVIMAQAFPKSRFMGFDFHEASITAAREHAAAHKLSNVCFEVALAKRYPGQYGLVTLFDCLHDMGDPVGVMQQVKQSLTPDGACLLVEPMAGDTVEQNLNPVGRLYYSASTMVCVPTSLAQEVGAALGAQAGEKRLCEVIVEQAGFKSLRRAAETPFNLILEARP